MDLELGSVFEGKVSGIIKFGAFIDFADGKTGLVHISEVAPVYVNDIREFLSEGQSVKVKVLSISDDGKIALSIKKAQVETKSFNNSPKTVRRQNFNYVPRKEVSSPARPGDFEWQSKSSQGGSFEDMMSQFKQNSDEKISTLKKNKETKRSGGYSRRESR